MIYYPNDLQPLGLPLDLVTFLENNCGCPKEFLMWASVGESGRQKVPTPSSAGGYSTLGYFSSKGPGHLGIGRRHQDTSNHPFVVIDQGTRDSLAETGAAAQAVTTFGAIVVDDMCKNYERLACVILVMATPQEQALLLKKAIGLRHAAGSCLLYVSNMIQQAMHEAIKNPALVFHLEHYIYGHSIRTLQHDMHGNFELTAYIHYIASVKSELAAKRLCDALRQDFEFADLTQKFGYKVYQRLAHLIPEFSDVEQFYKTIFAADDADVKLLAQDANGNFVLSAIFMVAPQDMIKHLSEPLVNDKKMWTHPKANYCVRMWLQKTDDANSLRRLINPRGGVRRELDQLKNSKGGPSAAYVAMVDDLKNAASRNDLELRWT